MRKLLAVCLLLIPWFAWPQPAAQPRLVLVVIVDQFRYDYLTRYRNDYKDGLNLLLNRGATFTNAELEAFPTVTAIGHSTILTGAMPSISGIVGNDWFDRDSGRSVTSVSDDSVKPLGGGAGASPRRLLVSSIGDEMKMAGFGHPRVIGISLKDRSAILPVGHMADGAYWFDDRSGNFVSSTYYFPQLPDWVRKHNARRPADRYLGSEWLGQTLPDQPDRLYPALAASPFGNELVEDFAELAIEREQLGQRDGTDLLAVGFSANDYVGHRYGPDSPEVRDMCIRTDKLLGKMFRFLESRLGMRSVIVVFTSDHGVAPMPELNSQNKMPGGRMPTGIVTKTVEAALEEKYGEGKWIVSPSDHSLYLNGELIRSKNLDAAEVHGVAAEAARGIPHVLRAYTREQLLSGVEMGDELGRRVVNGFHAQRGADVYVLLEPYWMYGRSGATHGTAFSYDTHIPIIFMGPGIKAGRYHRKASANDIAPTLSTILNIAFPSGSTGRILREILVGD